MLEALVQERSDGGINGREIGETPFALQTLEVQIHRNILGAIVAMVLQKVASGNRRTHASIDPHFDKFEVRQFLAITGLARMRVRLDHRQKETLKMRG